MIHSGGSSEDDVAHGGCQQVNGTSGGGGDPHDLAAGLLQLRDLGVPKHLTEGAIVFREGDEGSVVYLVEDGLVRLTVDAGGHPVAAASAAGGELIGAVEAITEVPRGTTAVAACDSTLTVVPAPALRDVVERSPALRNFVLRRISAELAATRHHLAALCSQSTAQRVAATLIQLSDEQGSSRRVRTTQSALAEWVGATRESTARALGELRRRGWITTGRGWIRLEDPVALAALAAG